MGHQQLPRQKSSNATVDFIDFPYRHVAVSPHQQKLRLAQALANNGGLDYYLIGRLDNHEDRSGYAPIKEMFAFHAANEDSYCGLTSKANVGLINGPMANQEEFRGWFRFLLEGHYLFDTLMESAALDLSWDRYDAMVLPDFQPVSDALAQTLDDFVAAGGTLIASGRSGFCDEDFEPRALPALACLGMTSCELVREDMRSSYFKLEDKTGFPRFDDVDLLYLDGPYVYADYAETCERRLKLIPPHNFRAAGTLLLRAGHRRAGLAWCTPMARARPSISPGCPARSSTVRATPTRPSSSPICWRHVAGLQPVGGNLSPMVEVTRFAPARRLRPGPPGQRLGPLWRELL